MSAVTAVAREGSQGVQGATERTDDRTQAAGRTRARYLDRLKAQIAEGTYDVDSICVADSMLRVVGYAV